MLVAHQEPVFERRFIHDSFACRRGKGTLAASDGLMTFLRQATANGRRPAWALRLDVASFIPSIEELADEVPDREATPVLIAEEVLAERLGLGLRGEGEVPFPVAYGVVFVGWRTWWDHRVPRRRTIGNVTTGLEHFARRGCRVDRDGAGRCGWS